MRLFVMLSSSSQSVVCATQMSGTYNTLVVRARLSGHISHISLPCRSIFMVKSEYYFRTKHIIWRSINLKRNDPL